MNGADSYFWHGDPLPVPERITGMLFIGIDPGVSGGIVCLNDHGVVLRAVKMPETDRDLIDAMRGCRDLAVTVSGLPVRAVLEKVNPGVFGRPGAKMGVVSAFTFGGNYRALKMALTAVMVPFDEVLPVKWQTVMGCRSGGDKNITKARAQQLFPTMKVTHAIADALLIAEYARRTERGSISAPAPKGLFDGEKEERTEEEVGTEKEVGAEAVAKGRRARAPRRTDPPAPAAGAVAGRRRGSR